MCSTNLGDLVLIWLFDSVYPDQKPLNIEFRNRSFNGFERSTWQSSQKQVKMSSGVSDPKMKNKSLWKMEPSSKKYIGHYNVIHFFEVEFLYIWKITF